MVDMEITNEISLIIHFAQICEGLGWSFKYAQSNLFPDAILVEKATGKSRRVEFEYDAAHFLRHRHDIRGCDFIVCWKSTWPECPLQIMELADESYKSFIYKERDERDELIAALQYEKMLLTLGVTLENRRYRIGQDPVRQENTPVHVAHWRQTIRAFCQYGDQYGFSIRRLGSKGAKIVSDQAWRELTAFLKLAGPLDTYASAGGKNTGWSYDWGIERLSVALQNGELDDKFPTGSIPVVRSVAFVGTEARPVGLDVP